MKKIISLIALIVLVYNLNAQITITNGNSSTTICNGYCGGYLSPAVSGGTGGYSYLWSNGSTMPYLDSLCAGTYYLTVGDNSGNTGTANFTITQYTPIEITATIISPVTCYGAADGAISITVVGGTAPYTYYENNMPHTTTNFNNLTAGYHTIYVTDANGCSASTTIIITQPTPLNATLTSVINPTPGTCNGTATINANGGIVPYSYYWSNGQTTATATNICDNNYTVTVTDANGCINTMNISDTLNTSDSTCYASFSWQYNPTNNSIQFYNLSSNESTSWDWTFYGQTITHSTLENPIFYLNDTVIYYQVCLIAYNSNLNCYDSICKIVNLNDSLPCSNLHVQYDAIIEEGSISGSNDGSVQISVYGGVEPYAYNWSNGATTQDIYNLGEGYYTVYVADANGCSTNSTVYVNNMNNYIINDTLENTPVDTCFNFPVVDAYVYNYNMIDSTIVSVIWAYVDANGNVAYLTEEYNIDSEGNYVVTSSINCNNGTKATTIYTGTIHIDFETLLGIEKPQTFGAINLYPNPIINELNIQLNLTENNNINISIINSVGQVVLQKTENLSSGLQEIKINTSNLKSGLYLIQLKDNSGNTVAKKIIK